jgi:hypothetical protein
MLTVGGTMAGPPLKVGRPDTVMSCAFRPALGSGLAEGRAWPAPAPVVPIVANPPGLAEAALVVVCGLGVELEPAGEPAAADSRHPGMVPVSAAAATAPAVTVLSATDASSRGRGTLTL